MKKYFILISIFSLLITSCERADFGDINQSDFRLQEADTDGLMRGAMVNFFSTGGRFYLANATLYAQYQAQTQYTDEARYNEAPGFWGSYYTSLKNLKVVSETSEDVRGNLANSQATAELMSVFIWKRLTDSFGPVPYTEALDADNFPSPSYDMQEFIYFDLIDRAKAARDMMNPSLFTLDADTDLIYGGNTALWKRFANSFIMNLALQMSEVYPASSGPAAAAFNEALNHSAGSLVSNAQNAIFNPDLSGGGANPLSELRPADYRLSKEFTDALQGEMGAGSLNRTSNDTFDNRLNVFSSAPTADGNPYGLANYPSNGPAQMANSLIAPGAEIVMYSAAHSILDRAEAAAIGWTSESATALLEDGILTSYNYWGVSGGAAYAADRAADADVQTVIGEEKWVALFPDGYAAWAEQRRTDLPDLLPAPDALNGGVIATRFVYPNEENTINPTNYNEAVSWLTPSTDSNSSRIWWDAN